MHELFRIAAKDLGEALGPFWTYRFAALLNN
jgi:hypothetical protein